MLANNISAFMSRVIKGMPSLTLLIVIGNPIMGIYEQFPFPKLNYLEKLAVNVY